jgi:hypothetical protein
VEQKRRKSDRGETERGRGVGGGGGRESKEGGGGGRGGQREKGGGRLLVYPTAQVQKGYQIEVGAARFVPCSGWCRYVGGGVRRCMRPCTCVVASRDSSVEQMPERT